MSDSSLFWKQGDGPTLSEIEKLKSPWTIPDLGKLPKKLIGLIAFDLETKDDGIQLQQGPSWPWKNGGRVVGYSFSADNWAGYLPIGHQNGGNLDPEKVRAIVREWMSDPLQEKVGANTLYDMGWSKRDGVEIKGPVYDVQYGEALLNEHKRKYNLDILATQYLGEGKDESLLRSAASAFGVDPKSGLWKLPSMFVGPYAEADADRTRRVYLAQKPLLEKAGLWDLYQLECSLLPLYLSMRWRGVRIDESRVMQLRDLWTSQITANLAEIKRMTGVGVTITEASSLAKAFDQQGVVYTLTAKTKQPSITDEWLESVDHPLAKLVTDSRKLSKLVGTFIDGHLIGHSHHGRIHCEFHPLKSGSDDDADLKGTVSGRLSSSNPNLQQIPTRDDRGQLIRACFLPEEGEKWWSADFSQQEPRLTVHYAASVKRDGNWLPKSQEAVQRYIDDPKLNYHKMVAAETGLSYKDAKTLNLALTYGRGIQSTAEALGKTYDEAKAYREQYLARVPYLKILEDILKKRVEERGELKTILGRHCRFPMWEPADWDLAKESTPCLIEEAKQRWPNIRLRRAWLHKVLNRIIQGSSADQTKKAMKNILDIGLGDKILLQIHDELCISSSDRKIAEQVGFLMENAIKLKVPVIVTIKGGQNWGLLNEHEK